MKKSLFSAMALSALMLASCANEDLNGPAQDGPVVFSVQLPGEFTRAISDGSTATQLSYAVYLKGEDNVLFTSENTGDPQAAAFSGLKTSLSLNLAKGKEYDIIFWADKPGNTFYDFKPATKSVEIKYDGIVSNDEDRDAFFQKETFKVTGAETRTVTLRRPFAQLNFATSDLEAANKAGLNFSKTQVTVSNVYNTLNLLTGVASNTATGDNAVTFAWNGLVNNDVVNGTTDATKKYNWLSMNYLLTGAVPGTNIQTADSETVNCTFKVQDNNANEINSIDISNVPVQRNYRTNIYGALLTSTVDFNIEIEPTYNEPAYNNSAAVMQRADDGSVICVVPVLPVGVTAEDLKDKGGVIVKADGTTEIFDAKNSGDIATLMQTATEIYFAPNVVITARSHQLVVPQNGITIHGNGATITGGEQDFSLNTTYLGNSTVNLTISNMNGVKVWGQPKNNVTYNVKMTGCSMLGKSYLSGENMVMLRGGDSDVATVNVDLDGCYGENVLVAVHTSHPGAITMKNCEFKNVGIPLNIAKKPAESSNIIVDNCKFDGCGIAPDSSNDARTYSAPVRVVDNAGPAESIKLTVDKCTFIDTKSEMDILLMDYREGKTWYSVDYTVTNCSPGNPTVKSSN